MKSPAITILLLCMTLSLGQTALKCENVSFLNPLRNRATWAVGAPIMLAYSFNCKATECKHELRVGTFRGRFTCTATTKVYQKKDRYRVECNAKHGVVLAAIMDETKYPRRQVPVNVTLQGIECAGTGFRFRVKRCPVRYENKRLSVRPHGNLNYKGTGVVNCIDPERTPFSEGRPLAKNQTICNANGRWIGDKGIECWKGPKVYLRTDGSVFTDNEQVEFGCTIENGYPTNTTTWLIVGDRKIKQPAKESFVVDHSYHNMSVYCVASNAFTAYHKTTVKSAVTILKILFPPTNFSSEGHKCSCRTSRQLCDATFVVTFIANPLIEDANVGVLHKNGLPTVKLIRTSEMSGLGHSFTVDIRDVKKEDLESLKFWANTTILGHRHESPFHLKLSEYCAAYTEEVTTTGVAINSKELARDGETKNRPKESATKISESGGKSESEINPRNPSHERNTTTRPPVTRYVPRRKATGRMVTMPYSHGITDNVTISKLTTTGPRLSSANTYIVLAVILLILLIIMLYFVVKAVTGSTSHESSDDKDHAEPEAQESNQHEAD